VAVLLAARLGLVWASAVSLAMLAVLSAGADWLLSSTGALLSPVFPALGLATSVVAMGIARFTVEHRRADRAVKDRTTSQRLMVQTLLSLTETRDAETGRHSRRTQQYARVLAEQLATNPGYREYLTPERIDLLSSLAPLHDIGKVGIPDNILNKPGALTNEERAEMRKHPVLGRDVILKAQQQAGVRDDATLAMAKDIVYTHHERWDGTGYPQGLREAQIPVAGRVMAIVDVYDATVSRSLYRVPMTHDEAVKAVNKARAVYVLAMISFAACVLIAMGSIAGMLSAGTLISTALSFEANVMLLTLIGSDLVITSLARSAGLSTGTTHLVDDSNKQLSAFVG